MLEEVEAAEVAADVEPVEGRDEWAVRRPRVPVEHVFAPLVGRGSLMWWDNRAIKEPAPSVGRAWCANSLQGAVHILNG